MSEPAARVARPCGIIIRPGNRRAMLEALQAGRQSGLRACSELVDYLQDRLAKSADRIEQLLRARMSAPVTSAPRTRFHRR
jgi:hypothetical protein